MKNPMAARRYAAALMEAAGTGRAVTAVARDLESVRTLLQGSRELRLLLASPVVSGPKKRAVVDALFGKRLGVTTMTFLRLLVEKGREPLLLPIVEDFLALRDAREGIVHVDVTTAVPLPAAQQKALTATLEQLTGKSIRLRCTEDAAVRGGLVVKIGDTVLDGSVRNQLVRLHQRFVAGAAQ
jgi:F-type H+-transporting ATPase subunit delta